MFWGILLLLLLLLLLGEEKEKKKNKWVGVCVRRCMNVNWVLFLRFIEVLDTLLCW